MARVDVETTITPGTDRYWIRRVAVEAGWRRVGATQDVDTFEPVESTRLDLVVHYRRDARGRSVRFGKARIKDVRGAGVRLENWTESIFVAQLWINGRNADPSALDQVVFEHRSEDGIRVRLSKLAARAIDKRAPTYRLAVHHPDTELSTVVPMQQVQVQAMAQALNDWFTNQAS